MKNEMDHGKRPYQPPQGTALAPAREDILLVSDEKEKIEGELVIDL